MPLFLLIICFTFGNVLLYFITKGILFWSFSFDFGVSNSSLSISDNLWNTASKNFLLKLQLINDSFNNFRFFESSEVSAHIFFRWRAWLYGILFIFDLGWAEYSVKNFSNLLVWYKQLSVTYFVLCFCIPMCLEIQCWF